MKRASDEIAHVTLHHTPEEKERFYWVTLPLSITAYKNRTSATVLTTMRINFTVPLFPKASMPALAAFLQHKRISYEQVALLAVHRLIEEEGAILKELRKTHPDAWCDLKLAGSITWPKDLKK